MRGSVFYAALSVFSVLWATPLAHAESGRVVALHCLQPIHVQLPSESNVINFVVDGPDAWLEVEDAGQQTDVVTATTTVINIPQPLRYGWHWVHLNQQAEVTIQRTERNDAAGSIKAILHCEPPPVIAERVAWLQNAGDLGKQLDKPSDSAHLEQLLGEIRLLEKSSPDSKARAIALSFRAEALAANNRDADASRAFESTETAWLNFNDRARALAARVGRIESLRLLGAYQSVLELTQPTQNLRGAQTYFSVRLANSRCLALQALGSIDEAAACFNWELASYEKLGETAEYVTALQNYASSLRDHGRLDEAQRLGMRGLEIASGPDAPMVRGRLRVMLADIALRLGRINESLQQSSLASEEFAKASAGSLRWQANTFLVIAILYGQLGANDEGYAALEQAVSRLSARDAPSRMAVAMNVFADLETNTYQRDSALFWRRAAEETYSRLNMTPAFHGTRLLRMELQEEQGDYDAVEQTLAENIPIEPLYLTSWLLLKTDLAIAKGRLKDAGTALDDLRGKALSMRDRIRFALIEAKYLERRGDIANAQTSLLQTAQRLSELTTHAGSPILRDLIARRQLPLQRSAYGIVLRHTDSGDESARVQKLWSWLTMTASSPASARVGKANRIASESFDRAVAAELLAPAPQKKTAVGASAQHELLSLLAQPGVDTDAAISTSQTFPLERLQRRLGNDSALIAFLDGGARGGLFWVTHEDAMLSMPPHQMMCTRRSTALRDALRSPNSSLAEIQSAAQTLSAQLLRGMPGEVPPKHLLVLADEMTPRIAWSVLTWPGQSTPLLDTTTVELVRFDSVDASHARNDDAPLHVIVASQQAANDTELASLATASAEPQLIQTALSSANAAQGQHSKYLSPMAPPPRAKPCSPRSTNPAPGCISPRTAPRSRNASVMPACGSNRRARTRRRRF